MTTATYSVTGMTCGHCVSAVTEELTAVDGVQDVQVALGTDAPSAVTVTSEQPLSTDQVQTALSEAGNYQLAQA